MKKMLIKVNKKCIVTFSSFPSFNKMEKLKRVISLKSFDSFKVVNEEDVN